VVIVDGDQHDPLCATYQMLEMGRLNATLKECGVLDSAVRRAVCATYFFNAGYFLDNCWVGGTGRRFRVGLYFAELDGQNSPTGTVVLPDPAFGTVFHEYAHGAAAGLFEDNEESVDNIECGDVNF